MRLDPQLDSEFGFPTPTKGVILKGDPLLTGCWFTSQFKANFDWFGGFDLDVGVNSS